MDTIRSKITNVENSILENKLSKINVEYRLKATKSNVVVEKKRTVKVEKGEGKKACG